MDFGFVFFTLVAHSVFFYSAMDQFEAAEVGDLQQLRATLTVKNVNAFSGYYGQLQCYTMLHAGALLIVSITVSRWAPM
jgi:hypothetical protein